MLLENVQELTDLVSKFRQEELEHLDLAVKNDSQTASSLIGFLVRNGCLAAIKVAKEI